MFAGSEHPAKLLIYLTIWGFIVWTLYLVISALSCSTKLIFWINDTVRAMIRDVETDQNAEEENFKPVSWGDDRIAWYQKVHWVFYTLGATIQIGILLLYWSLLFPLMEPEQIYNAANFNLHMTGGVMAFIDTVANGIHISIYHFYILIAFGSVYSVFTGIYFVANGTDPNGNPYIYPVLDYSTNPGAAAGTAIATTLLLMPLLHVAMYALSCFRRWLSFHLRSYFKRKYRSTQEISTSPSSHVLTNSLLDQDLGLDSQSQFSKVEMGTSAT